MSGIDVLSDTLKGGNKVEKISTPKGKDVSDSSGNAAAIFAAMLSGVMSSNVDSKGQNSKEGQESEEKQSDGDPVQSVQNLNEQGSMLGYGNFVLTNLFQPLQSDLPAGKEANSGNDVSQGSGGLAVAKAALTNATMLNLASLVSDEVSAQSGMTTPKPQGDNPGIAELDKYRLVIADLLVALTGKITDPSLKTYPLNSENAGVKDLSQEMAKIVQNWMTVTDEDAENVKSGAPLPIGNVKSLENAGVKDLSQEMAKIVQGWMTVTDEDAENVKSGAPLPMGNVKNSENAGVKDLRQDLAKIVQGFMTVTDDVAENSSVMTNQKITNLKGMQQLLEILSTGIGSVNPELKEKAVMLLSALNPLLRQGFEVAKDGTIDPAAKGSSDKLVKKSEEMGKDLKPVATLIKDPTSLPNAQQKSDGMPLQDIKTSKIFQGSFRDEVQTGERKQSTEVTGVKDVQNLNSTVGVGVASNLVATNVADGKTIALPVWEQIVTVVIREQGMDRHQALKELNIQLHPADLGKIQIGMRWENGQVHLVVHASVAATGQLLQNQLSDLRQNLTNQGVNCGMMQMGQGEERQQNSQGNESQKTFNQYTHPNGDEDLIPVTNYLSLESEGINRLNVTA